ncbi:MAG: Flp pilus assembly complex ATPase component TadA [Chitinispirillaceae bacterium]|nr:Flp pilus assembly complex ATPase component TadA [Chitinispirillaceae bacterium]
MSAAVKKEESISAKIALLSFRPESRSGAQAMLQGLEQEFRGRLSIVAGDFINNVRVQCDIAIAVYDAGDDMGSFISRVTDLREKDKIQIVFALITREAEAAFILHRGEIPTNHLLQFPMQTVDFSHAVMTAVAALRLKDETRPGRSNYASQAKFLGSLLVDHGVIDPLQLKKALDQQKQTKERLGNILVSLGYISEDQKMMFLAQQLDVEIASPRQFTSADLNVVALIPERIARSANCIALEKKDNTLVVAMEDVLDLQLLDNLRDITGMMIKPILGIHEDIQSSLDRYFRDISSHENATALIGTIGGDVEYVEQKNQDVDIDEITTAGSGVGVIRLVNTLIMNAVRDRASDIHFEPQEKKLQVRYRIDGELKPVMEPPKQLHAAIVARIKILANLDIAERRLPQDGRMVVKIRGREVDIRISILPSVHGEAVVMRILDKEAFEKNISNLGFNKHHNDIFRSQITKPYGMIIVTGPTGSGKSTTLYAAMQQIKHPSRNIVTVEDPVEFHIESIRQVHINSAIGLTFATVLRSILRQDPDIILIGEIRDLETADTAIKMALTGHLVFSTLHTNDAVSSISRFVDIGIPPLLLSSSLNLVVAQRLVRRICPECKVEYAPEPALLEQLKLHLRSGSRFYRGEGCVACNGTGFFGRTGLFEMLPVTKSIRTLILRNAPAMEIYDTAVEEGMVTVRQSGIEKVLAGETTIEQVIAVSTDL